MLFFFSLIDNIDWPTGVEDHMIIQKEQCGDAGEIPQNIWDETYIRFPL